MAAPDEPPQRRTDRTPDRPGTIDLHVGGRIDRADIPNFCDRARVVLDGVGTGWLVCEVGSILEPDAATVDALARIQLAARQLGREIRLAHASPELRELLDFMGLGDVLPSGAPSGLGAGRQTEEREQAGRVEEEADPADPAA